MSLPVVLSRRLLLAGAGSLAGTAGGSARAAPAPSARPRRATPAPQPRPLIMLDPGHGGKDPGAIGWSGTYEKHAAFATALELQLQLQATGRFRVLLTRTADVFIPLAGRVARAQEHGAALFVSVHADSIGNPGIRGASVYTLATTASDAESAALAERENSADRFGDPQFRAVSPQVAEILASLVRQETRSGSARLQRSVVSAFDRDVLLLPNPARHAGFVVLKAADIPSVLVEMGFMSNPRDEAALRQPAHRARVANALTRAVSAYFEVAGSAKMAG
ncbi:MAG: N-acetylmuramoyl-L-alanine amidase [Acetobacteraceae bacterium]|nr:N-acetylmuramoyl-L-alanine amidase [Acetobacteraceae bacterium]